MFLRRLALYLALALVAATTVFELGARDRILPHIYVSDVAIGGLSQPAAVQALHPTMVKQLFRTVRLRLYGRDVKLVLAADLGYRVDLGATVRRAYAVGHSSAVVTVLGDQWSALTRTTTLPLVQSVNPDILDRALNRLLPTLPLHRPADRVDRSELRARLITALYTSGPALLEIPLAHPAAPPQTSTQGCPSAHCQSHLGPKQSS